MWDFPLFPEQASTIAGEVDRIYFVLLGLAGFFGIGVAALLIYFVVKYRHTADVDRSNPVTNNTPLEVTWIVIPLFLSLGVFTWAARVYFDIKTPPSGETLEVYAVGKQWMWKFQHPSGAREINALHVPAEQTVKMIMTSQDVIHSFFVPAFRVKQDVLPGRYTEAWFQATKPGTYHLFCAEYCGTEHSHMGGTVYVMDPAAYAAWLQLGTTGGSDTEPGTGRFERTPPGTADRPLAPGPWGTALPERRDDVLGAAPAMAAAGAALFRQLRCNSCHRTDSTSLYPAQGPSLYGVYGHPVQLRNERTIVADEQYLLESILYPQAKLAAGYPAIMPTYKGQITDEELMQLVAYLKSLGRAEARGAPPEETASAPPAAPSAQAGAELFARLACGACHRVDPEAATPTLAPLLYGLYGRRVTLQDGTTVTADEAYLRRSILHAQDQLVDGYGATMPAYAGRLSEADAANLVAYLKTLR